MAGDFNQLPNQNIVERTGLIQIVCQPAGSCLHLLPTTLHRRPCSNVCRQERSPGRHRMSRCPNSNPNKDKDKTDISIKVTNSTCQISLQFASTNSFESMTPTNSCDLSINRQSAFGFFYSTSLSLLSQFTHCGPSQYQIVTLNKSLQKAKPSYGARTD